MESVIIEYDGERHEGGDVMRMSLGCEKKVYMSRCTKVGNRNHIS